MKIVKSKTFISHKYLTMFLNDNNIAREDILTIDIGVYYERKGMCTIFFYGDPDIKEKSDSLWEE